MILLSFLAANEVTDYFRSFGYVGIFFWFITVDQLTPLPEEITLIVIGYLASEGIVNPFVAGIFSIAAFLTIDNIYFFLTKSGSKFIGKLTKRAEHSAASKFKERLSNNMPKTLLILCFIPRMRLLAPVFVALAKASYKKFLLYDALSLCLFTSVYVSVGYLFHRGLSSLLAEMEVWRHVIFIIALLVMIALSLFFFRTKKENNSGAMEKRS